MLQNMLQGKFYIRTESDPGIPFKAQFLFFLLPPALLGKKKKKSILCNSLLGISV